MTHLIFGSVPLVRSVATQPLAKVYVSMWLLADTGSSGTPPGFDES